MNTTPTQLPIAGLHHLATSMRRYLAQKQARELAEQRLQAAFGIPVQADGGELTMKEKPNANQ